MKRPRTRHHTEEELLMHLLHEEVPDLDLQVSHHLEECDECKAVFAEYRDLLSRIQAWNVPEVPEESWRNQKAELMAHYRQDFSAKKGRGLLSMFLHGLHSAWDYALENPLAALGYVAVAVAFALERTITTFRLDQILPSAGEVFEILRQVF
jgi:hypothetical protein